MNNVVITYAHGFIENLQIYSRAPTVALVLVATPPVATYVGAKHCFPSASLV